MGNSNSQESSFDYILDQWEPYHFEQEVQIMRNMNDGRLAERKDIFLDAQNVYQNDADIYKLRKQNKFNLVQVCAVQKKVSTNNKNLSLKMCQNNCTQIESYQILTQYIVKRLDQINFYKMNQFLYALHSCLIGYRKINTIFGKVKIRQKMIGVNYKGQLKVWVNQNFADNMPQSQIPDQQKGDEQIMILNVFQLLQARCKFNFQEVSKFKYEFQPFVKVFRTSIRFVQSYIQEKNLQICLLPNESSKKEQDRLIFKQNVKVKQQFSENINQLTSSNKSFNSAYNWHYASNNLTQKMNNLNHITGKTSNYNQSQKRSPYMKLDLMQSFAKTQPRPNEKAQIYKPQVWRQSQSYYNFNQQDTTNIKKSSASYVLQERNKNFHSFGFQSQRKPVLDGFQQLNFPIYKRLSEAKKYQNLKY